MIGFFVRLLEQIGIAAVVEQSQRHIVFYDEATGVLLGYYDVPYTVLPGQTLHIGDRIFKL